MESGGKTGLWARKQGGSSRKKGAEAGKITVKQGTENNYLHWEERMGTGNLEHAVNDLKSSFSLACHG